MTNNKTILILGETKKLLEASPQEYLQIPNSNYIIAEHEPEWTKGFNYETSHKKVLQKALQNTNPSFIHATFC